jgi:hypothetical protein
VLQIQIEVSIFFLHGQKYGISLVSSLFSGIQSLKLKTAETNCTLNFISNYPTAAFFHHPFNRTKGSLDGVEYRSKLFDILM